MYCGLPLYLTILLFLQSQAGDKNGTFIKLTRLIKLSRTNLNTYKIKKQLESTELICFSILCFSPSSRSQCTPGHKHLPHSDSFGNSRRNDTYTSCFTVPPFVLLQVKYLILTVNCVITMYVNKLLKTWHVQYPLPTGRITSLFHMRLPVYSSHLQSSCFGCPTI